MAGKNIKSKSNIKHYIIKYIIEWKPTKKTKALQSQKRWGSGKSVKKKLKNLLKVAFWLESTTSNPASEGIKYWCQDETRLGLKTIESRKITAFGVKPVGQVQLNFKAYYLYGAIAPQTRESFWLEFSYEDSVCFQIFLDKLASKYPDNLNIIQLDNGRFHQSNILKIPDNVLLIFQPPGAFRIKSNWESMAVYKTQIELGNLSKFVGY